MLCLSYVRSLQGRVLERIRPLLIQQLYHLPIIGRQTPLLRLELAHLLSVHYVHFSQLSWTKMKETYITHSRLPHTLKPHRPPPPRSLDRKTNINPPMQLVHLAPYPGHLTREIDLVSKHLSRLRARPERI